MSDLTSLSVENFKAFGERQSIPIRPITLLYGQNSAGKSSIIDAVLLLHHLATNGFARPYGDGPNFYNTNFDFSVTGNPVRLGNAWDFVHGKMLHQSDDFKLGCTVATRLGETQLDFGFDSYGLSAFQQSPVSETWLFRLAFSNLGDFHLHHDHRFGHLVINPQHPQFDAAVRETIIAVEAHFHTCCATAPDAEITPLLKAVLEDRTLHEPEFREALVEAVATQYSKLRLSAGSLPPQPVSPLFHPNVSKQPDLEDKEAVFDLLLPSPTVDGSFADSFETYVDNRIFQQAVDGILARLECVRANGNWKAQDALRRIAYCGPMRETFDLDSMFPPAKTHESGDAVRIGGWAMSPAALDYVNGWLQKDAVGAARYSIKMTTQEISDGLKATKINLEDLKREIPVGLHEVGSGIAQVIPVLLAAAAYKDHLICIKQPELHLHPAIQADVADAFVRFAGRDGEKGKSAPKTKFLIETHSEHLLLRLMRRIRESTNGKLAEGERPLRPEDVAVLYVENLGTHSIVREMPLNENGQLVRDWPGGFFEEGLREVLQ